LLHAALLSAGVGYAGSVEAAPGDWLEWIRAGGAEECPDAAAFAAKIEKHLGRSPALAAGDSQRRLVAHIEREANAPAHWSAAVDVFDPAGNVLGRRAIAKVGASCESAADALALVSALILSDLSLADPASTPQAPLQPETSSAAASGTVTTAGAPVSSPALASDALAKTRAWALAVEGGLSAASGLLPDLDLGGEVRLFLAPTVWPAFYAMVARWQQATQSIPDGRGAHLDLWTAGLGACPVYARSPGWALALCAGGDVGRLSASGFGFSTSASDAQWNLGLSAGAELQRKLAQSVSAALGLEIVVPLTRARVAYAESAGGSLEVWRASPVAGVGSLRLGYAFW
jgi:hypothetical protein